MEGLRREDLAPGAPCRRDGRRTAQRRRRAYGPAPPSWWPRRLDGWVGPRSPNDGKSVTLFTRSGRHEFQPAMLGERRGHSYPGEIRPDAADLEERLERLGHPTDAARTLATISSFEGGFDTVQTYARGKLAWGFIQFTADRRSARAACPDQAHRAGRVRGVLLRARRARPRRSGPAHSPRRRTPAQGRAALNRLHDEPSLWRCFLLASGREVRAGRSGRHRLRALLPPPPADPRAAGEPVTCAG